MNSSSDIATVEESRAPAGAAAGAPCLPELLAPAGDWECAKAAVENGADAIYFGLSRFNARMRAHNFTEADLPELMAFLHRRGVKGYITFNTLVFADELAEAEQYVRTIVAAGVDAAIVQDVGVARLIRRWSPDFPIHASTQMSITSAAGVEFARELGCNLVVLARENSLKDIEQIQESQHRGVSSQWSVVSSQPASPGTSESTTAHGPRTTGYGPLTTDRRLLTADYRPLPLEVFVHGALCVAYSGQCLTSEALGGRSANRGECAQACRMPYELIADGRLVALKDQHYLLSPQDLAGLDVLPELVRLGVASLKIEGRLKSPQYVASITRIYRQALDECGTRKAECGTEVAEPIPHSAIRTPERGNGVLEKRSDAPQAPPLHHSTTPLLHPSPPASVQYEMEMAFSRGLQTGWFRGTNNRELVHARFGKKRGVFLGDITGVKGESVLVRLAAPLKPGDGVVIDTGTGDDQEQGGRVFSLHPRGEATQVCLRPGQINPRRVRAGDKLWKTDDPELNRRIRRTYQGDEVRFRRPLHFEFHGAAGAPLRVIARDDDGHIAAMDSRVPLVPAEKHPLTGETLAQQFGRLGGTPFQLGRLENRIEGALMLPLAESNRLRRALTAELDRQRTQPKRWKLVECGMRNAECGIGLKPTGLFAPQIPHSEFRIPHLIVLVRSLAQLEAALRCGVETVYCDFEDPKKYRDAVRTVRAQSTINSQPSTIFVAPPRIFKPGEDWTLNQVRSCEADGYLVRNYDHLRFFADCRRRGDFSLNIANPLAAAYFIERYGLERVNASYDLNILQLDALLRAAPPEWFEITIHQHMPMFHMEHCVFCAFLTTGKDYRDCGRPCDKQDVKLRDRVGVEHPLKADIGCRNTVFHGQAQTGAEFAAHLLGLGVRHFRVEFVNETPEQVERTVGKYQQLLRGEIDGTQLWRELKLLNQLGVTRGQLEGRRG